MSVFNWQAIPSSADLRVELNNRMRRIVHALGIINRIDDDVTSHVDDFTSHVADTANPHAVTAAQAGAAVPGADNAFTTAQSIQGHTEHGSGDTLSSTIDISTVLKGIDHNSTHNLFTFTKVSGSGSTDIAAFGFTLEVATAMRRDGGATAGQYDTIAMLLWTPGAGDLRLEPGDQTTVNDNSGGTLVASYTFSLSGTLSSAEATLAVTVSMSSTISHNTLHFRLRGVSAPRTEGLNFAVARA